MKKVMIAIFILLFPLSIKAYECSSADKERLQKLANNISVTLNENDNGTFTATFTGVSNEIRIYAQDLNFYYHNVTNNPIGETTVELGKNNVSYLFKVKSNSEICLMETFKTITINVPAFNPYYKDSICTNAKEFSLCQKNVAVDMSYNDFVEKVSKYINDNKKDDTKTDDVKKDDFWDFMDFYNKYYWPMFIAVISIFVVIVILWMKENKKNKL